MSAKLNRPEGCMDEHLDYLDDLRVYGETNMFGAASYLMEEFPLTKKEAKSILIYWMETFGNDER